jgi:hypothetical protein
MVRVPFPFVPSTRKPRSTYVSLKLRADHIQRAATLFDGFFKLTEVQVCNAEKPRCDVSLQDGQICTVAVEPI